MVWFNSIFGEKVFVGVSHWAIFFPSNFGHRSREAGFLDDSQPQIWGSTCEQTYNLGPWEGKNENQYWENECNTKWYVASKSLLLHRQSQLCMCLIWTMARSKLYIREMSEYYVLVIKVTARKVSTVLPISSHQTLDSQEINYMVLEAIERVMEKLCGSRRVYRQWSFGSLYLFQKALWIMTLENQLWISLFIYCVSQSNREVISQSLEGYTAIFPLT